MNSRLMSQIVKELNQIERKEKSIKEAEFRLSIQKDLEHQAEIKARETPEERRARENRWIMMGKGFI
jgi:hypothetical protein